MTPIQKLLFACVGVLALHGVQACSTETELNPQPLPPEGRGSEPTPVQDPEEKGDTTGGSSSGTSGSSGSPASAADGGDDGGDGGGDAADAGVH